MCEGIFLAGKDQFYVLYTNSSMREKQSVTNTHTHTHIKYILNIRITICIGKNAGFRLLAGMIYTRVPALYVWVGMRYNQ